MQARFWGLGGCGGAGARSGRWWCSPKDVPAGASRQGRGMFHLPYPASPIDTPPGGGVATVSADPPSRFCLCPVHGYPGDSPQTRREAGVIRRERFPVTRERQGRGTSRSPPRQPLPPRGRFPIDTPPGSRQPLCRQREHPNRDPAPLPCARLSGQSPCTARPPQGGGRRRGTRREAGVIRRERFFSDTGDRGGEKSRPHPRRAP